MLLDYDSHRKLKQYTQDLNRFYLKNPALWQDDYSWNGFQWIVSDDKDNSVVAYLRKDNEGKQLISICNFTPVTRKGYKIGVPKSGTYSVVFSSADEKYGGRGESTAEKVRAKKQPMHGLPYSIELELEGLSAMFIKVPDTRKKITEGEAEKATPEIK